MNDTTIRIGRRGARRRGPLLACGALLLAAGALASCIVFTGRTGDSIRFPEAAHQGLFSDCGTCHDGVVGHAVDSTTRRALEAACLKCHQEKKSDCGWCHADVASAGRFPDKARHLQFSHETHLERTHGDCDQCHPGAHAAMRGAPADAKAAAAPPEPVMPAHPQCFSCHPMQKFYDRLECANCHQDLARFGLKPYESFTHSVDFVRRGHADLIRVDGNSRVCAQCHAPRFCDECHFTQSGLAPPERLPERVDRDFIHRGDYVFRHPWDARADPASCLRCHARSACEECHDQRGVSERGSLRRSDGFVFHGAGVLTPGSPDFHGTAARRDILACAVCHADGASGNCVTCHSVGQIGGNPHPPGFRSRLDRHGAPVCRLCHG
jgi:hypothetical protein